ncbi:NAD(+) synthase [Formicincola oecophyllae]|uniref:Glutamine-dependent NAD(+) synthetase n=1 Tax=Formicincola oecophyllae TaxID=2558361 RepID=A0A4Y6UBJ3_9PROT|nr:NAD(+) synthase [Formicincola oecophyllae]QDH13485.1 NAD(+) synthase [Formicincola oecophyllae]
MTDQALQATRPLPSTHDGAGTPANVDPAFRCLYSQGFARVVASSPPVVLSDPEANAATALKVMKQAHADGAAAVIFPELGLTGYSLDDLHLQADLGGRVEKALAHLLEGSQNLMSVGIVGLPVRWRQGLYNAAAVFHRGKLLGVVPKTHLPRYGEFYETRHFLSGAGTAGTIKLAGQEAPFGTDLIFRASDVPNLVLGVELCEDLWALQPPSTELALAGATVIGNLSASPVTVGRSATRAALCASQSHRIQAAYVYASAGAGESTTDLAWDGQTSIHERGALLAMGPRFNPQGGLAVADVDLAAIAQERLRQGYHTPSHQVRADGQPRWREVTFALAPGTKDRGLLRDVPRFPWYEDMTGRGGDEIAMVQRADGTDAGRAEATAAFGIIDRACREIFDIQSQALAHRLRSAQAKSMVLGVSGGLDSALALAVACEAADLLGWERSQVIARSMPGFGTGAESRSWADALMAGWGVQGDVLDIRPAAKAMLETLGHPYGRGEAVHDVTFENVQAGLRTDFLFRLANQEKGLVVGTGDMSELALGWCTYGVGDQMAHYNVNAGLPKTVVQRMVAWLGRPSAHHQASVEVQAAMAAISEAEISPELIPGTDAGSQSTEAAIGPYMLQDFTLHQVLAHGFGPRRIAFMAEKAWSAGPHGQASSWPVDWPQARQGFYELPALLAWLRVFGQRFMASSQFKRSAMPNGPKVMGAGALSPRGNWRAPSDGNAALWQRELDSITSGQAGC